MRASKLAHSKGFGSAKLASPGGCVIREEIAVVRISFLIIVWLIPLGLSSTAQDQSEVLGLEQAVTLALDNNRSLKNAALEVLKQEDSLAAARMNDAHVARASWL
jgi:hypothetical protein